MRREYCLRFRLEQSEKCVACKFAWPSHWGTFYTTGLLPGLDLLVHLGQAELRRKENIQ